MPRLLSAKKRMRQNARRHMRNRAIKSRIRTARKAFVKSLEARDLGGARKEMRRCEQMLHRAANNGPLHRNTAARHVGRMQRRLDELAQSLGR